MTEPLDKHSKSQPHPFRNDAQQNVAAEHVPLGHPGGLLHSRAP